MKKIHDQLGESMDVEEQLQFEDDSNELPPEDVFAFNELRSCADLFRLYENHTLEIHPDFQRNVVWKNTDQTRFIDSLVKNLPIPSLCFSLDAKTGKMQVIDGLQRISAICKFLGEDDWSLSSLDDIDQKISGKTVENIKSGNPKIYEKVQNVSLPITLLRCDYTKKSHTEYIFTIFRRLNTGGMKLTNQEIRNAVYAGSFNNFLKESNNEAGWKKLISKAIWQKNSEDRFKSVELILRFFSFFDRYSAYQGRLSVFLNDYMQGNRSMKVDEIENKGKLFKRTLTIANGYIFTRKCKSKLSAAVLEAIMFGLAKNIDFLEKLVSEENGGKIINYYNNLVKEKPFQTESLSEGLYKKQRTLDRLHFANRFFSGKGSV